MSVVRVQSKLAPEPRGNYSQAVRVGDLLFISGQLPLDAEGHLVEGTIAEQTQPGTIQHQSDRGSCRPPIRGPSACPSQQAAAASRFHNDTNTSPHSFN